MALSPHLHMKKNSDQIYLDRLIKSLERLLKILKKGKPGSAFTKAEIRALSNFTIEPPTGLTGFVRKFHAGLWLIREVPKAKRPSVIYYFQMLHSLALRQFHLLKEGDIQKLKKAYSELRANNVMYMDRKRCIPFKDEQFDTMIVKFLKTGGKFNDHIYKNIAMLPGMYVSLLDYYLNHKKDISGTRQWYDFLAITNFMLNGIKLEILLIQKLKIR